MAKHVQLNDRISQTNDVYGVYRFTLVKALFVVIHLNIEHRNIESLESVEELSNNVESVKNTQYKTIIGRFVCFVYDTRQSQRQDSVSE